MRDILRAVFRRPRETTVIVQVGKKKAQVGTGQVLMRGTPKDPEELRKFVEQIMREVEQPPKPEGVDGSGATTGSDADE
ncbi:hypothetical protein [Streptomyces tendae]|uniref:hypothetical protein n=1 Tax=Streptomyces tendae TaxID=1932 RepID=UPI0036AA6E22